jgi:hypothetical protein
VKEYGMYTAETYGNTIDVCEFIAEQKSYLLIVYNLSAIKKIIIIIIINIIINYYNHIRHEFYAIGQYSKIDLIKID